MKAFIRTDQRQMGFDEDGSPVVVDQHYAVVENEAGQRWAHDHNFDDAVDAETFCSKVQDRLDLLGMVGLDLSYWNEIDPRYGSSHHQSIGDDHLYDDDDRAS